MVSAKNFLFGESRRHAEEVMLRISRLTRREFVPFFTPPLIAAAPELGQTAAPPRARRDSRTGHVW